MNTDIKPCNYIVTKVKFFFNQLKLKLTKSAGRTLAISPVDIKKIIMEFKTVKINFAVDFISGPATVMTEKHSRK